MAIDYRLVVLTALGLGLCQPSYGDELSDPISLGDSTVTRSSKYLKSTAPSTFISQSVNPPASSPVPGLRGVSNKVDASGSVKGKITDFSREHGLADAHVVIAKVDEEHKRFEAETGADGSYTFNNLEPGTYKISVSAKDMLSHTQTVIVASGEIKTLDVPLDELEPTDVMRITGKRTLIHPEKIGSETNIDHKTIYQYRSGNDLRELVESTPGVMNDSYGNVITRGEHNAINYEIDGVVIPEAAGVLQQSQPISPRSLQSMRVDIGGYEAQDGGGPLGAVAHMKSLPINPKPNFSIGQQMGGPLAGNLYYNTSGAVSQKSDSFWSKVLFESSGQFRGTSLGIAPPTKVFVNNNRADINVFSRLEYRPTDRDTFKLDVSINETFLQVPISKFERNFGDGYKQHDRQDYFILSYQHRFSKFLDELNLHLLNGFYSETFKSNNMPDPNPDFNAGQPLQSIAANARRSNYVFSAQGDVNKNIKNEHHLKLGFLSEVRPVHTVFNANYYNSDFLGSLANSAAAIAAGGGQNPNPTPFLGLVSPFTGAPGGPQFQGQIGKYNGFRYLQSAYFQDRYTPQQGFWKRLTLDAGVRFDMMHSVYGNAMTLAETIATIPGVQPFSLAPYQTQRITDAQASGRYGASFVVTKNTVVRASYSDLFMPTPNDYFLTPYQITGVNPRLGVYDNTPRPLHATRGQLIDTSVETQLGKRFVTRTNLFYKFLQNFGDSGVVGNLPLYNRLTNSAQQAYGVETRIDLKPNKDGFGFNGFLSNTIQAAYLRQARIPSGGFYASPEDVPEQYPDHDRRYQGTAGLGYKSRNNWWYLWNAQVQTGLQDARDIALYGLHTSRTPVFTNIGLSAGYITPKKLMKNHRYLPSSFDLRCENLLNERIPLNLGSPFQGTRWSLPFRFLIGCAWQLGPEEAKLAGRAANQI